MLDIRFCLLASSVEAHTSIRFLFAFPTATALLLRLTLRPYFSPIFSGIVRQGAVTRSISRRLLYPFVSHLAVCRHLEDAVNLQFYCVLLHSIRALVLVGYQPNDKERTVIVAIIIANFVPFTLARLAACPPWWR